MRDLGYLIVRLYTFYNAVIFGIGFISSLVMLIGFNSNNAPEMMISQSITNLMYNLVALVFFVFVFKNSEKLINMIIPNKIENFDQILNNKLIERLLLGSCGVIAIVLSVPILIEEGLFIIFEYGKGNLSELNHSEFWPRIISNAILTFLGILLIKGRLSLSTEEV